MAEPVITTVIPTYNRARMVVAAVESAVEQTYPEDRHEILVVDDGSDDAEETEAALKRFGDRVRLLRKSNGGVSSARNLGIAHARGEHIAFLDSDDTWLPEKLRLQADLLSSRPDLGMVLADVLSVDIEKQTTSAMSRRIQLPRDGQILGDVLRSPLMLPSSAMVRRSVIEDVGGFDESLKTAEDIDFFLRVARRHGVALIDKVLVRYRSGHDYTQSLSNQRSAYDDYMTVIRRFVERHADEIPAELRDEALLRASVANARGLVGCGWYGDGLRYALQGARHARRLDQALQLASVGHVMLRKTAKLTLQRLTASPYFWSP